MKKTFVSEEVALSVTEMSCLDILNHLLAAT
jgi:hypothetical protein